MGSTLNNGDCDYGDLHETYTPPFDLVCPELPGKKTNLHQSACDIKLAMPTVPRECRKCKGIGDNPKLKSAVARSRGFTVITPSLFLCKCGKVKEKGFKNCPKCKREREVYRKQQKEDYNIAHRKSGVKLCSRCKKKLDGIKYKFCPTCRPLAKAEGKKRNADRQRELRKQKREMK